MSANDDLPALRRGEALIRDAMARERAGDRPLPGRPADGARARRTHRQPRRGPRSVGMRSTGSPRRRTGSATRCWADDPPLMFQWHSEAFSLPPGAQRLGGNAACANQAFALGPHLAMQFHVELDAAKLAPLDRRPRPGASSARRSRRGRSRAAQAMHADAAQRIAAQQRLAAHAYARWLDGACGVACADPTSGDREFHIVKSALLRCSKNFHDGEVSISYHGTVVAKSLISLVATFVSYIRHKSSQGGSTPVGCVPSHPVFKPYDKESS